MSKEKISKQELKQELENGKTVKEIAYEYGYGHPSRALNDKLRELGYFRTSSIPVPSTRKSSDNKYYLISVTENELEQFRRSGEDHYFKTVKDNQLVIKTTDREWEKQ